MILGLLFKLFAMIGGALLILMGITGLTASYSVSIKGIQVNHIWKRSFIEWDAINEVASITNFSWGYVVIIRLKTKKSIALLLPFKGNGNYVLKSIIEAGTISNPQINFTGMHAFGRPPYGIFKSKQNNTL